MSDQRDRARALAGAHLSDLFEAIVREVQAAPSAQAPTPLVGVRAAKIIAERAHREIALQVRRARQEGHTWDEIGEALGLTSNGGRMKAEAAFESVARRLNPFDSHAFGWRCTDCDQMVGLLHDQVTGWVRQPEWLVWS